MKKSKIITILIIVLVIVVAVVFFYIGNKKTVLAPIENNPITKQTDQTEGAKTEIIGNKNDLLSFSINPGSVVSTGEQKVSGIVQGGYFFEGNILLRVLDSDKKVLSETNGKAITDWMNAGPVSFEGTIDFTFTPGDYYIEIHNDNASGLPENNKSILIPIVIK